MKKVLHHLRKQPDHVKSRYVILFAVIATVIVVIIWMITIQLINRNDDTIKTESPFKIFGSIFSTAISETKKDNQDQKLDTTINDIINESVEINTTNNSNVIENSIESNSEINTEIVPQD